MGKSNFCGGCYAHIGDVGKISEQEFEEHLDACPAFGEVEEDKFPNGYTITVWDGNDYPAFGREYKNKPTKSDYAEIRKHLIEEHVKADIYTELCSCSYFSRPEGDRGNGGYIYLIKQPEQGYEAYKIGIGGGNGDAITDKRLLTHLRFNWELVAIWECEGNFNVYEAEQNILRDWRTRGIRPALRPRQMKQKGFSETAAISHWGTTQSAADLAVVKEIDKLISCKRIIGERKLVDKDAEYVVHFPKDRNQVSPISPADIKGFETYRERRRRLDALTQDTNFEDWEEQSTLRSESGLEGDDLIEEILFPTHGESGELSKEVLWQMIKQILLNSDTSLSAREITKLINKELLLKDVEISVVKSAVNSILYRKSSEGLVSAKYEDDTLLNLSEGILGAPYWKMIME